jgi:hypothetical protein
MFVNTAMMKGKITGPYGYCISMYTSVATTVAHSTGIGWVRSQ